MENIIFETGETYPLNFCGERFECTPIYVLMNGSKRFVANTKRFLSDEEDASAWYFNNKSKSEAETLKKNLMKHDGKYITFHAPDDDPFIFLTFVKENDYIIESARNFFAESEDGDFTDFHGKIGIHHGSFRYRIYDEVMLRELKEVVDSMKKQIIKIK